MVKYTLPDRSPFPLLVLQLIALHKAQEKVEDKGVIECIECNHISAILLI